MSLLTDALTKPEPTTDNTAESAITELEEALDISGELDESSRDPTIQTVALDELMLEELEATRRLRQAQETPPEEDNLDEADLYNPAATDVLSAEDVMASQSIVLEELPAGALDSDAEPLAIVQEPPTLTDTEAKPDLTRIIMPDPASMAAGARPMAAKKLGTAALLVLVLGAGIAYFATRPSDETTAEQPEQVEVLAAPTTLSSLGRTKIEPTAADAAENQPAGEVEQTVAAPVPKPDQAPDQFEREPATDADVSGFAAAATKTVDRRQDSQGEIEIARTRRENPVYLALKKAYTQFQSGDFAAASVLYQRALEIEPNNIDALLGKAAIAQRENNLTEAQNFYRTALSLEPKNSIARAGLMSLRNTSSTVENESELKTMLTQQPRAAHLHFALGLHYVSQSRWPDAQQSFFEAVRHDPQNADYAFNLAVSLDQLGKRDAAAVYYRESIELARGAQKFEVDAARNRLNTLTANR